MKATILATCLFLSACGFNGLDQSNLKASSVGCVTGATWNGSPASILVMNQEEIVGTKGGIASVKCGGSEITFTDNGNLDALGLRTMRVPVQVEPLQLRSPR